MAVGTSTAAYSYNLMFTPSVMDLDMLLSLPKTVAAFSAVCSLPSGCLYPLIGHCRGIGELVDAFQLSLHPV